MLWLQNATLTFRACVLGHIPCQRTSRRLAGSRCGWYRHSWRNASTDKRRRAMNVKTPTRLTAAVRGLCTFLPSRDTNVTEGTYPPRLDDGCNDYSCQHRQSNAPPEGQRPPPIARIRPVDSLGGHSAAANGRKWQEQSRGRWCYRTDASLFQGYEGATYLQADGNGIGCIGAGRVGGCRHVRSVGLRCPRPLLRSATVRRRGCWQRRTARLSVRLPYGGSRFGQASSNLAQRLAFQRLPSSGQLSDGKC